MSFTITGRFGRHADASSRRAHPSILYLLFIFYLSFGGPVQLLAASPAAVDKNRSRAERALREGEFELAEKLFRELVTRDGHDHGARLGLSYVLLKQRNLRDAFDHAARVVTSDPLSARAHALLGAIILAGGDFLRSVEEFRTALSLEKDEALAVAGLAMVDFYESRLNQSLSGLRRAAFLDPNEPDYIFSLGQVAARTERYKEAADAYERFLQVAPRTDADRRNRIRGLIDFLRYLGTQSSLYEVTGESQTSVAFEAVNDRPVLQVRINGFKQPLRFVLDTGSGMSVVSEETAKRLGIKDVARGGLARGIGGGGRFEIVYGFLSSMEIGEVRVLNVPVYIRKFFNAGENIDGYIGLSVISKFIATVDYKGRTFDLLRQRGSEPNSMWQTLYRSDGSQPGPEQPVPALEIPFRFTSSGFLSGEVRLEGVPEPLNFIIDTGATITVVAESLARSKDLTRYAQVQGLRIYGAAGIAENVTTLLLPRVSLGAHLREGVPAAVLDLESVNETAGFDQTGIIGGNFLRHFRVTFDFRRAAVRLEPYNVVAPKVEAAPKQR